MQSEDVITELFDNFKYPEFKTAYDKLIPFEQREITEVIEEALNIEFQNGYKEAQEESENVYDVGYESGKSEGFIMGLKRAIEIAWQNNLIEIVSYLESEIENES